jgi:RNA recognition motif-containing protein
MSFTVFLGNIPAWVTADDIRSWLTAENLVSDSIKVIRNPETQESKGFAFIEAPNGEEMQAIIRRFDRAPLEDRLLRANPAQPPKSKQQFGVGAPAGPAPAGPSGGPQNIRPPQSTTPAHRRGGKKHKRPGARDNQGPQSAFAEELAKAL